MPSRWFRVLVGSAAGWVLAAPPPVAAQSRSAAIAVSATVRSAADADVLGAQALVTPEERDGGAGVALVSDTWRIVPGRASSVGLQVDTPLRLTAPSGESLVTICDDGEHDGRFCEPYRAPRVETRTDGSPATFVVRVANSPRAVRVTLAFIDF